MSIHLGEHSYAGQITNSWDIEMHVGKYTSIASGLILWGNDHPMGENVSTYPFKEQFHLDYTPCTKGGKIEIGSDVWVGMMVSIREGVTIHDGAIIGAFAVITKDVAPYSIVVGNPQRYANPRFWNPEKLGLSDHIELIEKLLNIKWWDWPESVIRERVPEMKDVRTFVEKYG